MVILWTYFCEILIVVVYRLKLLDDVFHCKYCLVTIVMKLILFSSFIYDVKSVTNEKNSADMFKSFAAEAKLKVSFQVYPFYEASSLYCLFSQDSDTEFVYHLIILTESHKTPHHSFNHEYVTSALIITH